jgi:pyroglutamyl-peptidase
MPGDQHQTPRRVLVTASAPFAGLRKNAAEEVAIRLRERVFDGAELAVRVLPVDYHALPGLIGELVDTLRPDIVLSMGTALGAATLRLETTAVNFADFSVADNLGNVVRGEVPFPGGPRARVGTWAAAQLAASLRAKGIPTLVSHHAGTHLCNLTLYAMLQAIERGGRPVLCGFAHLPLLPEQVAELIDARVGLPEVAPVANVDLASMSLDVELNGIVHLIEAMVSLGPPA